MDAHHFDQFHDEMFQFLDASTNRANEPGVRLSGVWDRHIFAYTYSYTRVLQMLENKAVERHPKRRYC